MTLGKLFRSLAFGRSTVFKTCLFCKSSFFSFTFFSTHFRHHSVQTQWNSLHLLPESKAIFIMLKYLNDYGAHVTHEIHLGGFFFGCAGWCSVQISDIQMPNAIWRSLNNNLTQTSILNLLIVQCVFCVHRTTK